jgi:hypothetical protein
MSSRSSSPSTSSTCSVEEVATLSPDAVLRRNFATAERSGRVLDLTEESAIRPPKKNRPRRTSSACGAQQHQQLKNHVVDDPATVVEVLGSLSPDAVRRRNYALAEKAGRVLDLTNSPAKLTTSGTPPAPALTGTATGTSSSSSNEASNHGTNSTAAGSLLAQRAQDNTESSPNSPGSDRTAAMNHRTELATSAASINNNGTTSSSSTTTTTTTTAPSRSTTPPRASAAARQDCDDDARILSQQSSSSPRRLTLSQSGQEHCLYYCQRCSVRVREQWMKLCGDCHRKRARDGDDDNVEAAAEVPASPLAPPPPPLVSQHSPSLSPVAPTFLDDVELGVPPPTPVVARSGQTTCRICSARIRDAWMKNCRQCHEEWLSSSTKKSKQNKVVMLPHVHLCLACHATLRHAWMTWCRECYERGLNDAAAASAQQHGSQNTNSSQDG